MKSLSFYLRELAGIALLGGAVASAACSSLTGSSVASSVVTTYAPLTTIEVDANALFAPIGCGTLPGEAYKYVVVVYQAGASGLVISDIPEAITITDCYTDALFQNLSNIELFGARAFFSLSVYVFDEATFTANESCDLLSQDGLDAVLDQFSVGADDGGADSGTGDPCDPNAVAARIKHDAIWQTTCTAQQLSQVESVAACDGLHD